MKKSVNKLLIIHGPNFNLLGEREPNIYGAKTLKEINEELRRWISSQGAQVRFFQSNCEGELIDKIHSLRNWATGIVINPGAYTHYSYAIRDALASIKPPSVEVHLSDIKKREKFRRISVIAPVCIGQISGLGWKSYLEGAKLLLSESKR